MFKKIQKTINIGTLSIDRKVVLQVLIDYIQIKVDKKEIIRLNFICTHNSRRSHLSQIWAQVMAYYFDINSVHCYSGGTEATEVYPMVVEVLNDTGFHIKKLSEEGNPVYSIKYTDNEPSVIGFSKKYDDEFNPQSGFGAVMTCSGADNGCPIVRGSEQKILFIFEDPKVFDGTSLQKEKYKERSIEIARDLYYVFSNINAF